MKYLFLFFCFVFVLNHVLAQKFYVPYEHNGKYGLTDEKFQSIITPAIYDKIEPIADSLFIVTKAKKKGVINLKGTEIMPIRFDSMYVIYFKPAYKSILIVATKNHKKYFYDIHGLPNKDLLKDPYYGFGRPDTSFCFAPSFNIPTIFKTKNNKWGIIQGIIVQNDSMPLYDTLVPPIYDSIKECVNCGQNYFEVYQKNKSGLISSSGEKLLPLGKYGEIIQESPTLFIIKDLKNKKLGFLYHNLSKYYFIPPKYDNFLGRYFLLKEKDDKDTYKDLRPMYKYYTDIYLLKDSGKKKAFYVNVTNGLEYRK